MTTRLASRLGIAVGFALALCATNARAGNPCIDDAKESYLDCKGDCLEGYQLAKDNCLNRDHDCVEGCRAGREECVLATSLDEDLTACRDTLRQAKQDCRDAHVNDPDGLDKCIDEAQVVAFLCRKAARTKAKPALAACRAGFRACAKACPPPPAGQPPVDPLQCKIDARNAYLACKADCREQFQTQKDLCLNRDHACVEGCRAQRDACRQPIEDQLDADIASCNATRDSGIQDCKNLYPEGDPNRDICITNVQVDAFECRDQARENAAPGFAQCRTNFQSCATACPPAQP